MTSVLYDAPGRRAKQRNVVYAIVFLALFALAAWWVVATMADKNQLEAVKWQPFITDARVWTTYLLPGLVETLKAAALSIAIALPFGALLGLGRLSDHAWVARIAGVGVEFFRSIPVLLLMMFANQLYIQYADIGSDVRPLYAVVTGLVLYNASIIAEIVRAGVLTLPNGQTDAAKAIGMRKGQTLTNVLLPQAVTAMFPALISQLVVIVKDTALGGSLLGLPELLSRNREITANYGANVIATLVVISLIYITLNYLLTFFASKLEARLRRGKKSTGAVVGAGLDGGLETIGPAR
jgi:glutamate transport system permease protein